MGRPALSLHAASKEETGTEWVNQGRSTIQEGSGGHPHFPGEETATERPGWSLQVTQLLRDETVKLGQKVQRA